MFRYLSPGSSLAIRVTQALLAYVLVLGAAVAGVNGGFDQRSSAQFAFDISVSKSDAPDPVYGGGAVTYSITFTFYGDANSVTISDPLPQGLAFVGDECHLQGVPGTGHGLFANGAGRLAREA